MFFRVFIRKKVQEEPGNPQSGGEESGKTGQRKRKGGKKGGKEKEGVKILKFRCSVFSCWDLFGPVLFLGSVPSALFCSASPSFLSHFGSPPTGFKTITKTSQNLTKNANLWGFRAPGSASVVCGSQASLRPCPGGQGRWARWAWCETSLLK